MPCPLFDRSWSVCSPSLNVHVLSWVDSADTLHAPGPQVRIPAAADQHLASHLCTQPSCWCIRQTAARREQKCRDADSPRMLAAGMNPAKRNCPSRLMAGWPRRMQKRAVLQQGPSLHRELISVPSDAAARLLALSWHKALLRGGRGVGVPKDCLCAPSSLLYVGQQRQQQGLTCWA